MYSGGVPEFIEGDVFKTIIPLSSAATSMVGPSTTQVTTQVNTQVATQDKVKDAVYKKILEFCADPKSTKEFGKRYLKPLIDNGCLEMTIPDKPTSSKQKYVTKK